MAPAIQTSSKRSTRRLADWLPIRPIILHLMDEKTSFYAGELRRELALRSRRYARGRTHVESYGAAPVVVYAPEGDRHGNFFDAAYAQILRRPEWQRRFDKVHAQARRALPKVERRWRELDSSMSSDALLMNVFCAPGVVESQLCRMRWVWMRCGPGVRMEGACAAESADSIAPKSICGWARCWSRPS